MTTNCHLAQLVGLSHAEQLCSLNPEGSLFFPKFLCFVSFFRVRLTVRLSVRRRLRVSVRLSVRLSV